MDKFETLYWLLYDANPGDHGEDFEVEVAMIRDNGMNAAEGIELVASRTAYVVGSDAELEAAITELLG